jgi:hypothetical protein
MEAKTTNDSPKPATENGVENGTEEETEKPDNDDITDIEAESLKNEARRRIKSCGSEDSAMPPADSISCLGNCHGGQVTRGSHVEEVVAKPVGEKKND